jgi:hypothetical protein
MAMMYRFILFWILVFISVSSVEVARAYQATVQTVDTQYEVIPILGDPVILQTILGELNNSPEMFEIVSETEFNLTVEIRALPNQATSPEFGGIIIRVKEPRGVEEVARLRAAETDWNTVVDSVTGLLYRAGPFWSGIVPAGTYRVEVSTPENLGKYMLVVGSSASRPGYFASLKAVALTYQFYQISRLRMFNSPYIHYPIGITVVIGLFGITWYWQRRRFSHA